MFLSQFEPRPIDILIDTAGALGTMAFSWRWAGDESYSPVITSDAGSTFVYELEEAFCTLTFAAGSFAAAAHARVDRGGTVTGTLAVTATRYDLRSQACSSVTAEAMTRMRDAVRPPLVSWSDDVRTHAAAMVYAILRRGRGATPAEAGGQGDQNVFLAEDAARLFFDRIGKYGRPDGIVDTPASEDGPLFPAMPMGDDLRGW